MDYTDLKRGDVIPERNRKIKEIIGEDKHFIVYLDDKDIICWDVDKTYKTSDKKFGKEFGNIENQISFWESNCNRLFNKKESFDYKCLLAEGYARMLDARDDKTANSIIKSTSERIKVQGEQILRQNYLLASFRATCIVIILLIIFIIMKEYIRKDIYEICLTGFMGGIGGFISSMLRAAHYKPILSYGKRIHRMDGYLRIVYGLIGGAIVAIGVKANIIFGFLDSEKKSLFSLYFLGAISGASEQLLPNIINQSGKIYSNKLNKSDKTKKKIPEKSNKSSKKVN
jgi:hypothetical protein